MQHRQRGAFPAKIISKFKQTMALLDEQHVDEWLNRKSFFTIRGLKTGVPAGGQADHLHDQRHRVGEHEFAQNHEEPWGVPE